MKHTCTEVFSIVSKTSGHQNGVYDNPWVAVKKWKAIPTPKRERFGVTCKEIYNYFDDNDNWTRSETYESFINIDDYL